MEIIHSVLNRKIPAVHEVRSDVPVIISMIIEKLTDKSPDERYTSAHGLREDLKECQRLLQEAKDGQVWIETMLCKDYTDDLFKAIAPFPLGQNDIASVFTLPNGCFGRSREIELITTIIRRTAYMCSLYKRRACMSNNVALVTPLKPDAEDSILNSGNGSKAQKIGVRFRKLTEIVSIYGDAGVGKSTLIRHIQEVAREYGYIAIVKFDMRQPLPYGCILRCMSIFLKNILAEPPSEIDRFAGMLKRQLGSQALSQLPTLLLDNVPELYTILEESTPCGNSCDNDISGGEIKMRFHAAFIEIFEVMVNFKFVTLFLEDLHQADEASIELLESLIGAKLNLLVILSYRKDELSKSVSKLLSNENSVVSFVKVDNLDQPALMDLVQTAMHRHQEIDTFLLSPLVDFIYKKTRGNPFYVCQLLVTLEKKGLLYFTWDQCRWEYNLQEIEKALMHEMGDTSEDIDIEFLVRRLKELPRDGRKFLKWASFIGNNFSFETVRHLMTECDDKNCSEIDSDNETDDGISPLSTSPRKEDLLQTARRYDAINGLQSALQQGFIQAFTNDEFRFSHDRYSQAAMMLAKPDKRDVLHLKIASHFVNQPNTDAFWVADHVKAAVHLINTYENKSRFRAVLVQAGDQAYHSGAHNLAFSYYACAQVLLSSDPWVDGLDSKYLETLHLYTRLAEISWFLGYEMTTSLVSTILTNAKSAIDRAAAYRIQHRYYWSRREYHDKASILLECLRELGIENIALDRSDDELRELYEYTRQQVLDVGLDKISDLPVCDSRLIRTRLAILEEVCLWAYWVNDFKAILSVGSRLVVKTLNHGTSPTTGVGFVFFGIAAMHIFKAYEFGQQIGEVGVSLCNKYGGNSESARGHYLYGAFLSSWKYHYRESLPMFRQALKQSLLGGDRTYAAFAHLQVVMGMFFCGEHLSDTLREARLCSAEASRWNDAPGTSILTTTVIRVILALQGCTYLTEDGIFDDKDFSDSAFVADMYEQSPDSGLPIYWHFALKLIVLVLYGYDEAAVKIGDQYAQLADMQPSFRHTHLMLFFHCLAMIRLIRNKAGETDELMPKIQKHRNILQEWAQHSRVNLEMLVSLIDAELSTFESDIRRTELLYDRAIDQAKDGGWGLETAIMYEFAGEYYMRSRSRHVGTLLIEKAIMGYRYRGCGGKADHLERRHGGRINVTPTKDAGVQTEAYSMTPRQNSFEDLSLVEPYTDVVVNRLTTPEETLLSLDVVDLASILKSSQVISSEMNFELLMKQMLGIILENSGAESGVIIIKEDSSFLIMGSGSQTKGCEILMAPKLLSEEADSTMTRIAQYAIHSEESVFIPDIQLDPRFSDYSTPAKSVICTPIAHKSAIVGCIYIEGAVGSLTSRHEIVLRLLSQQIGISVSNALLFKSVQSVTYDNVKMIEKQKAALEEARMSKEAALRAMKLKADFLANMSHELRTPFSGFYGMISLLSETSLDVEQLDIVHTAKESCEMLLKIIDDLLNFSKLEAGKVVLDLGPLVVEEVIADTIEILSSLAARKGLELAYIVDPDVPKTIVGDSSRLRQILTNLLGNAIKFTHHGGVVIKCHLDEELDDDYIRLKFEVIDTGIGIKPEQQRNLFEPFSQVDGSTTRMYGGTGLGLSICLQLVCLMMGTISVESVPGEGSNFWFTGVVSKMKVEHITETDRSTVETALSNHSILLATHHDPTANMLQSLLPEFQVRRTSDLQHAIAQALRENHDILLFDIPSIPSGYIAHQLQSVDDDPECDLHIIVLYTAATEGHKLAAEATNSASDRRGRIVKMAKPARRAKLLRTLEHIICQPKQQPLALQTPSPSSRMSDYFNAEELAFFEKKPVLIAEDNMVAQKLLRKQLEKMGFIVESANNGEEAVQLWRQRPTDHFCIGFFDHHMPKCDGVEATKRIRELESQDPKRSRLPIIALSADIQMSARDVCVNAGMDGYLTKPLILRELAVILRRMCLSVQNNCVQSSSPS
ncbi:hypothetical protein EC973_001766 [Apophysomyces ossiformis]|uniref:histidine kinase n=1 Tax=Apophysomyces ossiformis TaxID=679940 RepID=A0A8H7EM54_9FUNG|nr:hypothetical protein EC973_001766 [Apophysomyces ossiformis]